MRSIPADLRVEAEQAFARYARVYQDRVMRRDGWTLHRQPLLDVLESGDPARVQSFINCVNKGRRALLNAVVV